MNLNKKIDNYNKLKIKKIQSLGFNLKGWKNLQPKDDNPPEGITVFLFDTKDSLKIELTKEEKEKIEIIINENEELQTEVIFRENPSFLFSFWVIVFYYY